MKPHQQPDPEGLARRVDKMLASGRITAAEADAIRLATTPEEADTAIDAIRQRHMSTHVDEAVAAGSVTEADGQELVERARSEGPEVLRGLRRKGKGTSSS
jgi:hypothetical protein